ncbi:MAG: hypothetical protein O9284_10825 [Steroidobacteraceae bacterium]|nr:hypothetical protein [Steroidobacteraceae bacterium]
MTPDPELLKRDLFGTVRRERRGEAWLVVRDTATAARWVRGVARRLAAREARALERLQGLDGVPHLVDWDGRRLVRTWLAGEPMQIGRPRDAAYFARALALLRAVHRAGVAHRDLAKEPNWLVRQDGSPALVDFQLALAAPRRSGWFRLWAREDLRHWLKHKRSYRPDRLTARQRRILATPAWPSRIWMRYAKPIYRFVTRRLLGWADREGAGDRRHRPHPRR